MKQTLLFLVLLFLSLSPLQADDTQPNSHTIVVGAFTLQKTAERHLYELADKLGANPEIVALQSENGFEYVVRSSGKFYMVAIEPIVGDDALKSVLAAAKEHYADAYLYIGKKRKVAEKPEAVAAPTESETPTPVTEAAVPEEPVTEVVVPEGPAAQMPASESVTPPATKSEPKGVLTPPQPPAASGPLSSDMMLYAGVGAAVVVLLLLILMRRKKSKEPEGAEEKIAVEPQAQQAVEEAPIKEAVEEVPVELEEVVIKVEEAVTPPVPEAEEAVAPQQEIVERVEEAKEAEELIVPAEEISVVSPRKKREPKADRGKISKDDFTEFSGMQILAAEDNLINQKVLKSLLAGSGIEITMANDGQEALNCLKEDSSYDLILMDAHMPVVDGFEATRLIRANPDYEHIAVVALSGDTAADDIRKMREAGMEEHLEKPLRMDALYDVLYSYTTVGQEESEVEEEEQAPDLPSTFELHAEKGLEISGGDEELYKEILHEFADMYGHSDEQLDQYLMHDDYEGAKALLLDIRGLAANIGATQLSDTAEELREALIDQDEKKYNPLYEEYCTHLQGLLKSIDTLGQ